MRRTPALVLKFWNWQSPDRPVLNLKLHRKLTNGQSAKPLIKNGFPLETSRGFAPRSTWFDRKIGQKSGAQYPPGRWSCCINISRELPVT